MRRTESVGSNNPSFKTAASAFSAHLQKLSPFREAADLSLQTLSPPPPETLQAAAAAGAMVASSPFAAASAVTSQACLGSSASLLNPADARVNTAGPTQGSASSQGRVATSEPVSAQDSPAPTRFKSRRRQAIHHSPPIETTQGPFSTPLSQTPTCDNNAGSIGGSFDIGSATYIRLWNSSDERVFVPSSILRETKGSQVRDD